MIIPLNIVKTYPVKWGKYKVFRDFVQNFYDSVGYRHWKERFAFEYDGNALRMWIDNICFSYEWLLHIGASTKTANSSASAGYFGEGFKIASLCAVRDYKWDVRMSSGNWTLSVLCVEQKIDTSKVQMLAYDIREREGQDRSCMELSQITEAEFELFKKVLLAFYYPENPLIGEKIWEGSRGAVYTRSSSPYDRGLPYTEDFGRKGAVFCAYQLLGSNPFDLVVCLHDYKNSDRERNSLYTFDVVDVFRRIARFVDARGAMLILEKMRRYWNSKPKKKCDIDSWSPIISKLIYTVCQSRKISECFREKYPNLLPLKPIYTVSDKNRRGQARAWLSGQDRKYLMVQKDFVMLGYTTLEELCERQGGFAVDDSADSIENQGFEILESIAKDLYSDFFKLGKKMPMRRIIRNQNAAYHGMAKVYRRNRQITNGRGLAIRYEIGEIYLKKTVFYDGGYYDALATYVHELCHMFGGDSSNSFSGALTFAMEILLSNSETVETYRQKWEAVYKITDKTGDK